MQVKTGKGTISLMVVMAIWSLSIAVDLPGLAVTPIEGNLRAIFPTATDFQIQLLTVLPNLVIIPFVLLSGKLSETRHKIAVITLGTVMYIVAGALSIFSSSLSALIWLSCLLGAGCGLILPFSTGLIADVFTGKYQMKQMGIISAIGNVALVGATFIVGFLATRSWHLPFLVYLLPLISLLLIPFLKKIPSSDYGTLPDDHTSTDATASDAAKAATDAAKNTTDAAKTATTEAVKRAASAIPSVDAAGFSTEGQKVKGGFYLGRTIWLLLAYGFFVFATTVPAYYLPNLMPEYHMSTEEVSTVTSVFYLAMFLVGLAITNVMKIFRKGTFILIAALLVAGMLVFVVTKTMTMFVVGSALVGLGNGMAQPIFYNKATEIVVNKGKSTLALAYLQVANYIAISIVPVIASFFMEIFSNHTNIFPFYMVLVMTIIVSVIIVLRYRHFVFGISKTYYE